MDLTSYIVCNHLDDKRIPAIAGALINGLYLDRPIPFEKVARTVHERDIELNKLPEKPIIKMARKEHVDNFFQDGSLLLGTFAYYNKFDHDEVGDITEGACLIVGKSPPTTAFAEIAGGFNNYAFCCYAGEPDDECIHRFGYDAHYEIVDVNGFINAIQSKIGALGHWFAECKYSKDKVLIGDTPPDFDFNVISDRLLNLVNMAKYFVKPSKYSNQSEFRIIWQMPNDVEEPLVISCPEAVQFCRRS